MLCKYSTLSACNCLPHRKFMAYHKSFQRGSRVAAVSRFGEGVLKAESRELKAPVFL
jgi:hypothetical protein